MYKEGSKKKLNFLGDMSPIRRGRGGVEPPPVKTICKKYSACPEKPFLLKNIFCIVIPSVWVQVLKKYLKKGTCPLKSWFFFIDALPKSSYTLVPIIVLNKINLQFHDQFWRTILKAFHQIIIHVTKKKIKFSNKIKV